MSLEDFEHRAVEGINAAKRCDIVRSPWIGDWFVSHSPRNGNSYAEGPWDHWVQLAVSILQHPATQVVRPAAFAAVQGLENTRFYDGADRLLSAEEIADLFPEAQS